MPVTEPAPLENKQISGHLIFHNKGQASKTQATKARNLTECNSAFLGKSRKFTLIHKTICPVYKIEASKSLKKGGFSKIRRLLFLWAGFIYELFKGRSACETDRQNLFFHNPGFSVSYQLIVLVGNGSPEYNPMFGIVFFNAFNRCRQGISIQDRR